MLERHRQGFGKQTALRRRVNIGTGRLIDEADTQSRDQLPVARAFLSPRVTIPLLLALFFFAALLTLAGCATQAAAPIVNNSIEIESVRMTAAGHYVDLRYRVLDAERANEVLGPGVKPLLIDEASGIVMAVPTTAKLGSLRQTRGVQRPDRSYFVLFVNSAGLKSGSRVTAEIGDMKFESLIIE